MKKRGSTSDFMAQRDHELLMNFRKELMESRGIPLRELFGRAARRPASRFWVSELRAAEVISAMMRGVASEKMVPQKKRMYEELLRRVEAWRSDNPGRPLSDAIFEAVNSEAPEFYITDASARVIIYRLRANRRSRTANREAI